MTEKERLLQIIREKSFRKGTFRLTSGKMSDFYVDCKQTTLSAEGAYLCGRLLFRNIHESGIDVSAVGGMTLGADPLVTSVSVVSYLEGRPIPAFIIRKEPKGHGTGSWIEGKSNVPADSPVVLVEDVVTTGGTLVKAIDITREEGYKVAKVLAVVDRDEGGRDMLAKRGLALEALFTRKEIMDL